jgi:pilus assembly protein CpaB
MSRHFGTIGVARHSDKTRLIVVIGVFVIVTCLAIAFLAIYAGASAPVPDPVKVAEAVNEPPPVKMIDVLVPAKDIDAGAALEPAMFRMESRPQVGVSPRVVVSFEELKGQFARSLIVAGQPLHRDFMTSVRPTSAITASIPEGYRAVTISVDARSAVEGWVRPGARVDVMWLSNVRGRGGITRIVQNARVLSAERMTQTNQPQPGVPIPSTVTLLVTSEDAAKISLAATNGSITLQLRGDTDVKASEEAPVLTLDDLLGKNNAVGPTSDCEGTVVIAGTRYCVKAGGRLEPEGAR